MKNKYSNKKTRKSLNTKLVLALLLLLLIGLFAYMYYNDRKAKNQPITQSNPAGTEKFDLSPATAADKKAVDQRKEELANQSKENTNTAPSSGTKKQVSPVITSASKTEVRAFIPGIVEVGGTCTVYATQGSQTITASSAGFDNVSYTQCTPLKLGLGGGAWTIFVTYSSTTSEGKSQTMELN